MLKPAARVADDHLDPSIDPRNGPPLSDRGGPFISPDRRIRLRPFAGDSASPLCGRVFDRRTESNDVAVGVDENALVLPPLGGLGKADVGPGGIPRLRQFISVVDPHICRT
jgi:hypothetical protein